MSNIEDIERDLSQSRADLKENVHALTEKLTLGRIVDEFVLDSRINWDDLQGKTFETMRTLVPGAIIGAGAALLIANGSLGSLLGKDKSRADMRRKSSRGADDFSAYDAGYDPIGDWETDRFYRSIETTERDYPRTDGESDTSYQNRLSDQHGMLMGYSRENHEDDHAFRSRVSQAVGSMKGKVESARGRLERAAARAKDSVQHMMGDAKHGVEHAMGDAKHAMQNGVSSAQHMMHDGADAVGRQASRAAGAVRSGMRDGVAKAQQTYDHNPMLGVALGVGIGALIGGLTPLSEQEEKMLAKPVQKATQAVARMSGKVADSVGNASDDVREALVKVTPPAGGMAPANVI